MKLTEELGEEGRKSLFEDIIMNKEVSYLKTSYCSAERKATTDLVAEYERIISQSTKLLLN
ncbi:MAG TPA: hypothetical protein VIG33_17595 [Pseudobdellovibrionaceae bacterium]|jgi:hypothetical protein